MAKRTKGIRMCGTCGVRRATMLEPLHEIGYVATCDECHAATTVAILCDCESCATYVRKLSAIECKDWARGWNMHKWSTVKGYGDERPCDCGACEKPRIHLQ